MTENNYNDDYIVVYRNITNKFLCFQTVLAQKFKLSPLVEFITGLKSMQPNYVYVKSMERVSTIVFFFCLFNGISTFVGYLMPKPSS